jgi:hypothetical protein
MVWLEGMGKGADIAGDADGGLGKDTRTGESWQGQDTERGCERGIWR